MQNEGGLTRPTSRVRVRGQAKYCVTSHDRKRGRTLNFIFGRYLDCKLYYNKAGRLPNPLSFLELMPGCAEHNHIMHLGMGGSTIPEMRGKAGLRFGGRSHIQVFIAS